MNHAERVKELAQEFSVAAVVAAIVGRLGDSKQCRSSADKKAAELLTAIDAMQSALDDAVAEIERLKEHAVILAATVEQVGQDKLAARDAEVERLRAVVKKSFMEGFHSPETYNDTVVNDANECWEKAKSWILGANSHAALSEEVKGGE